MQAQAIIDKYLACKLVQYYSWLLKIRHWWPLLCHLPSLLLYSPLWLHQSGNPSLKSQTPLSLSHPPSLFLSLKMKNNVNNTTTNTKLILLHPYIQKQGTTNRLWFLAFISLFTIAFLLTVMIYTRESIATTVTAVAATGAAKTTSSPPLPKSVVKALLHYAANSNITDKMSYADTKLISDALRHCSAPCNFLVFGLTAETLLWKSLNHNGRTVIIEENRYRFEPSLIKPSIYNGAKMARVNAKNGEYWCLKYGSPFLLSILTSAVCPVISSQNWHQ